MTSPSPSSAAPLVQSGITDAEVSLTDYNIDEPIVQWMENDHTQSMCSTLCHTSGNWEGWAQFELECELMPYLNIVDVSSIREGKVYRGGHVATFVLPQTAQKRGMVIELSCEDRLGNSGHAMNERVYALKQKAALLKAEYKDYTFIVLAMAYKKATDIALTEGGLTPIAGAQYKVPDVGTMRLYKMEVEHTHQQKVDASTKQITGALANILSQKGN